MIAQLDQRLADLTREAMAAQQDAASANAPVAAAAPDQCGDMLIALAEVELNLTRQLAELPMAVAAPDMTPGARPEAAAPPAPAPAPAQPAASRPRASTAQRATAAEPVQLSMMGAGHGR